MMNRLMAMTLWVVVFAFGAHAHAQSATTDSSATVSKIFSESGGISTSVGVRLWGNQWDLPRFDTVPLANAQVPGGVVLQDTVTTHVSAFETAAIPFVGARVGNVVASVSYFVPTHYDARTPLLSNLSRDELDVTLGYSMLPVSSDASLVVSVGYKRANINEFTSTSLGQRVDSSLRIDGALIGASGNAPLTDNLRLYGNAAYGFARQKTKTPIPGEEANNRLDSRYKVSEVGLSYLFFHGAEGQVVRSASVSLGYRAQVYTIKSFLFMTRNSSFVVLATDRRDVDSTTQGPILTVSASF